MKRENGALARRFSDRERSEIAALLEIAGDSDACEKWIPFLEEQLEELRLDAARREREWADIAARERLRAPRGRPPSERNPIVAAHLLRVVYRECTGRAAMAARGGRFYRLCQICLRQADPQKIIRALIVGRWRL